MRVSGRPQKLEEMVQLCHVLLFGETTEEKIQCVVDTLEVFCNLSRKHFNNENNSAFFSTNTIKRISLVRMSGYHETNILGSYLGVPLI